MSRNEQTLICPKCKKTFLHTPDWASPVCPNPACGYRRDGDKAKPKFQVSK